MSPLPTQTASPVEGAADTTGPVTDKRGNDLASDGVFMIAQGIFNGWVCAPKHMSIEAVQAAVDHTIFPAGTTCGWQVQERQDDDPGMCSPGECAEDKGRQHWVVFC